MQPHPHSFVGFDTSAGAVPKATLTKVALATLALTLATAAWWKFGPIVNEITGTGAAYLSAAKLLVALVALVLVWLERRCARVGRPLTQGYRQWGWLGLAALALVLYFHGLRVDGAALFHRHEQYHYYMGSKYFPEIGYSRLYLCALVAQDEIGTISYRTGQGDRGTLDLSREARDPSKVIRRIGTDNLLTPAAPLLEHPERCKQHFTPPRWESFKKDVLFFRGQFGDPKAWALAQMDHGYNPPPVWTMVGRFLASLQPASLAYGHLLASLDLVLLAGMFASLYWAYGWRVMALAAIFLGCGAMAPFGWTGGAILRQDWLFLLVLSACLLRRHQFGWAGAALATSFLLRVFPLLAVIGMAAVAMAYWFRQRRWHPSHFRVFLGGVAASVALTLASVWVCGVQSYEAFYRHTLVVHDSTPLANHMGLRVLFSQTSVFSDDAGTMKSSVDLKAVDPWAMWKQARLKQYSSQRLLLYGVILTSVLAFCWGLARAPVPLWVGLCLGPIWMVLMAQLTCYYYSFLLLCTPLAVRYAPVGPALLVLAAASQLITLGTDWFDVRYTLLSAACVAACSLIGWFVLKPRWRHASHRSAVTEAGAWQ